MVKNNGQRGNQIIITALGVLFMASGIIQGVSRENICEDPAMIVMIGLIAAAIVSFICIPANRFIIMASVGNDKTNLEYKMQTLKGNVKTLQEEWQMKERVNKAKSKFMNRMSHDLRTPMNAIIGYSMLLERCFDDPEKVSDYTRKIQISSRALLDLINDVLDMSYIESGNVRLANNEFSIKSTLTEVRSAIRPQIEAKNQKFNFYMTDSVGKDRIVGDKGRFCQVLRNLLSNATKYTPEGGSVEMIVDLMEEEDGGLQFLCQIKDNGCGMSEEFLEKLFCPFERENGLQMDNVQGTGLGMSIAKSFVDLMKGEIAVESKVGVGTLVTVKMPIVPVINEKVIIPEELENHKSISGLRFLVAEDNEMNAEIISEVLKALGGQCVITENGQEVVEVFEASDPEEFDMVLMDIQMPVMDGYQATAALRKCKHPKAREIMILAMTADAFEEDVQRAFVSGMNGHVAKPLDIQSLINTVEALRQKRN